MLGEVELAVFDARREDSPFFGREVGSLLLGVLAVADCDDAVFVGDFDAVRDAVAASTCLELAIRKLNVFHPFSPRSAARRQ